MRRTGAVQPWGKEHVRRDGYRVPVMVAAAAGDRHPLRWTRSGPAAAAAV